MDRQGENQAGWGSAVEMARSYKLHQRAGVFFKKKKKAFSILVRMWGWFVLVFTVKRTVTYVS